MYKSVIAALLLVIPSVAHAEMSVGTFLAKAEALKKKGMTALFSPDVGVLKKEMGAVTTAYRAELKAARAAGRKTHSCPPAKTSMNSDDLMKHFRSLPPSTSLKAGFYDMMKTRFPCPA